MKQYSDVIVIGGGAAGMISAVTAAERQRHVVLMEKLTVTEERSWRPATDVAI